MNRRFVWTFALAASILVAVAVAPPRAVADNGPDRADPSCLVSSSGGRCELPLPGWLQALLPSDPADRTDRAPVVIELPGVRTCLGSPASVMLPPWLGGAACDVRIPLAPADRADRTVETGDAGAAKHG
jgi:hypothetical protein